MPRIDAHQHFWQYDPVRDAWIGKEMGVLKRDFLPEDLAPILQPLGFNGCVAVQADQSVAETRFLLQLAERHPFIRGVVGWVDLCAPNLGAQLEVWTGNALLKGFRHILQGEVDRAFMLRPEFINGVTQLQQKGYTYDILVHADQLHYLPQLVEACPGGAFILDHLGKPPVRTAALQPWATAIRELARFPHVSCKLSGLVTEGDWQHWKPSDFVPFLDVVLEAFGTERLLFGSDWPVCRLAARYEEVLAVMEHYFSAFSKAEQEAIFGGNAARIYQLD